MKKRHPKTAVPLFVGSLTALTALSACVLTGIDPYTTMIRGLVAYAAGHFAGALWDAIFGDRSQEIMVPVEFEVRTANEDRPEQEDEQEQSAEGEKAAA